MSATQPIASMVSDWLAAFEAALAAGDSDAVSELFLDECHWRDLVAFTWNIKTLDGKAAIRDMLDATLAHAQPTRFAIDGEATEMEGLVEGWFTFDTATAHAQGCVRLVDGRAWTVLTAVTELIDHPEATGHNRPFGTVHSAQPERQNWRERRRDHQARLGYEEQPYCLIVGGGQAGIALAARLKEPPIESARIAFESQKPSIQGAWRRVRVLPGPSHATP